MSEVKLENRRHTNFFVRNKVIFRATLSYKGPALDMLNRVLNIVTRLRVNDLIKSAQKPNEQLAKILTGIFTKEEDYFCVLRHNIVY